MLEKRGTIIKVAGSLVVARGLEGEKMFNLVRVSNQRLIGEIVALEKELAYIQVYEETAGLSCGEPVYSTGSPLSVELGPGLLNSIYDGIQRPLPLIEERTGCYIERGIELAALNRQKKWKFTPLLKVGDVVENGDVLGEVLESETLKQRILVTNLKGKGKIKSIRQKGEYSIEQIIAEIEDEKGKLVQEKMYHTWPVRQRRPFKRKLGLSEIMVTGQRVIDTFFPLMKGGTGCVPGGFGTGKCVSGDTLVIMGNGRIVSMKEIFKESKKKGKKIKKDSFEEIYNIEGLGNPSVIAFRNGKFDSYEPITAYKGKSNEIISIRTKTGKKIKVTPIHKLFVLNDGKIQRKMAKEIKEGDYLLSPRKIKLNLKDQFIPYLEILKKTNLFSGDQKINNKARKYLKELIKEKELPPNFKNYLRPSRKIPLKLLSLIFERKKVKLVPQEISGYHGKVIKLPLKTSPEFGEFLGYLMADGNLKKNSYSLRFYNSSEKLLTRFSYLSTKLFNTKPYLKKHLKGNSFISQIDCKALFEILAGLGVPFKQKAGKAFIPEIVLRSSDKTLLGFIWSYINCDGNVDVVGSRIEISSKSGRIIKELVFALLRFGILASIGKQRKDKCYRLSISNSDQLRILLNYLIENRIFEGIKIELLKKSIKERTWSCINSFPLPSYIREFLKNRNIMCYLKKEKKIHIERYLYSGQNIGSKMFKKIIDSLSNFIEIPLDIKQFFSLIKNVFFEKIIKVKKIPKVKEVYDIEVPQTGNFVGGSGPLVLSNTVVQHQLCRWSDADIIVFVATGERGNEVADLLIELTRLKDPRSDRPLMERSVLIANTSNMPVAAREASIYTGITIAEYFRDMGYNVALIADSTSRWAEALREIAGRLEEMPGEEGYPTYLPSRTASFYERAGRVKCLGSKEREGSVAAIGAVSPPGGDFSEPVTQNTLRVTKVFWELDTSLAYQRHFPAINWLDSYSLYKRKTDNLLKTRVALDWPEINTKAMSILQQEAKLQEIALLVGVESLADKDKLTLQTAKSIREDFLIQNAFDEVDSFTSLKKQYLILKTIISFHQKIASLLKEGRELQEIDKDNILKERISKLKYVPEDKLQEIEKLAEEIQKLE